MKHPVIHQLSYKFSCLVIPTFLSILGVCTVCNAQSKQVNKVALEKVFSGLSEPTDLQFFPGSNSEALVLQKQGRLEYINLNNKKRQLVKTFKVLISSEQGLLGLAFHPKFPNDNRVYINKVVSVNGKDMTQVTEYALTQNQSNGGKWTLSKDNLILQQPQPYVNHNAGQLAFGPDGYLYIGFGDGGSANDPLEAGQDPHTWLGKMLRIDINKSQPGKSYAIPQDNPFVEDQRFLPEIWAYGLRNPWRYMFDAKGRLIVADVGQNKWEEVSIIPKGGNMGWNIKEAHVCFQAQTCKEEELIEPIFAYDHTMGQSITGGYIYQGVKAPELKNKYIFGDFVSGVVWAVSIPESTANISTNVLGQGSEIGKWPILISSFGQNAAGEVFVLDYGKGDIYEFQSNQ